MYHWTDRREGKSCANIRLVKHQARSQAVVVVMYIYIAAVQDNIDIAPNGLQTELWELTQF